MAEEPTPRNFTPWALAIELSPTSAARATIANTDFVPLIFNLLLRANQESSTVEALPGTQARQPGPDELAFFFLLETSGGRGRQRHVSIQEEPESTSLHGVRAAEWNNLRANSWFEMRENYQPELLRERDTKMKGRLIFSKERGKNLHTSNMY